MSDTFEPFPITDAILAQNMMRELDDHSDAEISVNMVGIFLDVYHVTFDEGREKIVLHLNPDDLNDAMLRWRRMRLRRCHTTCDLYAKFSKDEAAGNDPQQRTGQGAAENRPSTDH